MNGKRRLALGLGLCLRRGETAIKRLKINIRKCTNTYPNAYTYTQTPNEFGVKTIKTKEHKFPAIKNSMFAIFYRIHLHIHTNMYVFARIFCSPLFAYNFHGVCFMLGLLFFVRDFSSTFIDIINYGLCELWKILLPAHSLHPELNFYVYDYISRRYAAGFMLFLIADDI